MVIWWLTAVASARRASDVVSRAADRRDVLIGILILKSLVEHVSVAR
jgi:hypothetical protein